MPYTLSDRLLIIITPVLGSLSLLLMMVFIFMGSLTVVNLKIDNLSAILLDSLLSIVFFVQHSGMVRKCFKHWSAPLIQEKYNGVVFSVASSLLLLALMILWQQSSFMIASAQGYHRWLLRAIFCLALLGFLWGGQVSWFVGYVWT